MPRYNIALVPFNDDKQFFDYFKIISSLVKPYKYQLGTSANESKAHVTLCQFHAENSDLEAIWGKVKKLPQLSLELTFNRRRTKTYPKESGWEDTSWISLMCDDQFEALKKLHLAVAEIVTPINASFDNYDPHLTLLNSLEDEMECRDKIDRVPNVSPPLIEKFVMALGESDGAGQLTKVLYKLEMERQK